MKLRASAIQQKTARIKSLDKHRTKNKNEEKRPTSLRLSILCLPLLLIPCSLAVAGTVCTEAEIEKGGIFALSVGLGGGVLSRSSGLIRQTGSGKDST
jgi:hypothetical protein